MIDTWIPVTIAAAFFQNLRSAIQKHLTNSLSGQGAAYARFIFALPWAILYLLILHWGFDLDLPPVHGHFLLMMSLGSVSQIAATVLLIRTFSYRSFAVGTTLSKLEIIIVALLGIVLLGDTLTLTGWLAIGLGAIGLLLLSAGQNQLSLLSIKQGMMHKSTFLGLGAAAALGASVVFFRGASLSLNSPHAVIAAALTLVYALTLQTFLMGLYLRLREPGQLSRVVASWRWSVWVGIAGMLASVGWFTAFTLQNASFVRALGQIELVFSFVATTRVFREKIKLLELAGCLFIVAGIILLLLS